MADTRTHSPSAPRRTGVRPAALVLGAAALAVAALLLLAPVGGTLGLMLAVVVAFAVIHVGCLTVGCRTGAPRDGAHE